MRTPFNKFLYIGFILLGLYQAIFSKDYLQPAASLGIALAFDPFNTEQKWNEKTKMAEGSFNNSSCISSCYVRFWNWAE